MKRSFHFKQYSIINHNPSKIYKTFKNKISFLNNQLDLIN